MASFRTYLSHPLVRLACIAATIAILLLPMRVPYRVLWLAATALAVTWAQAGRLAPLGLARPRLWPTLGWALSLFVLAALLVGELLEPALERMLGTPADYSGYGALAGDPAATLRLLGYAWLSAAIGEEIVTRGFLLSQGSALVGDGPLARTLLVALAGLVFALAHAKQGTVGVIATGLIGLTFGAAWFLSGRNLWALILAHGLTDSYGIAQLYLGRFG